MNKNYIFTSEAVTKGHPDKVCDQISDAIVDDCIRQDAFSRVACETMLIPGKVVVAGEISSKAEIDVDHIVKRVLEKVCYTKKYHGLSSDSVIVEKNISPQSDDISMGVDNAYECKQNNYKKQLGAGDQGIMHGYATCETAEYMPVPHVCAQKIVKEIDMLRESGEIEGIMSDGKAQVSVEYSKDFIPQRIHTIIVSIQHLPEVSYATLEKEIREKVIERSFKSNLLDEETRIFINPTGRFVTGGVSADCGVTGRKIIVDTYGGFGGHGGGAFSGKDPSKVDRSGAYMARYIAKNLVASRICKRVMVQIAYAIGMAQPMSFFINTYGTGKISDSEILHNVMEKIDLSPQSIIEKFNLRKPIYENLAVYGHFGRSISSCLWEMVDYRYLGM